MDPISLAVGAALLATGWLTGRVRRGRASAPVPAWECGCGHSFALHNRETSECTGETKREHYTVTGARNGYEWVQCSCRRYVGEVPIDITTLGLPGMPRD
jgi:hypothetical protein